MKERPMRALTILQPWASLIVAGIKGVENRTWMPPRDMIGQRFAVHAGRKLDMESFTELHHGMCGFKREQWPYAKPNLFPVGAVIGVATLHNYVRGDGTVEPGPEDHAMLAREPWRSLTARERPWYFGPVGFVLLDPRQVEPVPCKGALGFWTLPDDVADRVAEQLARAP